MGDSEMSKLERRSLLALRALAVGLAYWATARVGVELAIDGLFTPLWLPSGIALVATFRWGPTVLVGVAFGEFVAAAQGDASVAISAALGIGNALEAIVAVMILHRLGMNTSIRRVRDIAALTVAAMVGAATSGIIATVAHVALDVIPLGEALDQLPIFWASAVLAMVLIAPLALSLLDPDPDESRTPWNLLEAALATASVAVVSASCSTGHTPMRRCCSFRCSSGQPFDSGSSAHPDRSCSPP